MYPLLLLSPSKTMNLQAVEFQKEGKDLDPRALVRAQALRAALGQMDLEALMAYYGISENLAGEVLQNLRDPGPRLPAGSLYGGEAFKFLSWPRLDKASQRLSRDHLIILSAQWGPLSPYSLIGSYRLDLKMPLPQGLEGPFSRFSSLKSYWSGLTRELVQERIDQTKAPFLLCAASEEFLELLHPLETFSVPVVTTEFLQRHKSTGKWKKIGTRVKQARGAYVRWALETLAQNKDKRKDLPALLQKFHQEGYQFSGQDSSDNRWVFVQEGS